jgi:catechol 2,3-dioxygenase-like lactoylglutathione lyase family enzyme
VKPPADGALPVPPHGTKGNGHMCFRVGRQALDAWKAKLEAAGVTIEADIRWPNGARSFYFRDPAGNSLECAEPGLWAKD